MQIGNSFMHTGFYPPADQQNPPVQPQKDIPANPDINPDPTKPKPGGNEPEKNDPTRIQEPARTDPTRIDEPAPPQPPQPSQPGTGIQ
jgi:hypothetical protein